MSTSSTGPRLAGLTKELLLQWERTREHWRDARALEFEKEYIRELEQTVNHTVTGLENLERLIRNIRNECE